MPPKKVAVAKIDAELVEELKDILTTVKDVIHPPDSLRITQLLGAIQSLAQDIDSHVADLASVLNITTSKLWEYHYNNTIKTTPPTEQPDADDPPQDEPCST